ASALIRTPPREPGTPVALVVPAGPVGAEEEEATGVGGSVARAAGGGEARTRAASCGEPGGMVWRGAGRGVVRAAWVAGVWGAAVVAWSGRVVGRGRVAAARALPAPQAVAAMAVPAASVAPGTMRRQPAGPYLRAVPAVQAGLAVTVTVVPTGMVAEAASAAG